MTDAAITPSKAQTPYTALKDAETRTDTALKDAETRTDTALKDAETRTDTALKDAETRTDMALKDAETRTDTRRLPGDLNERYAYIGELGTGAQGSVFLAKRRSDGILVAIKVLRIDSIKTWKEYTLFHREANVLASLDIPGIATFHEACDYLHDVPPCSCIVQSYIEGTTLKQALNSGYRFSLHQIYDIALQLIDILEKLHKHDPPVIHRDIKPSNIILQPNGPSSYKVFLIDFGAVANPQIQSGGSTIAGTYGYMAPEQHLGRPAPQSDTYALAALIAYMLSGVDPAEMQTQNLRLIIDPYVENHPPALVQTLRRMLDPSLEDRLADLDTLRTRFENFKKGLYILDNEPHQPFEKPEFKRRLRAVKSLCEPQNLELWQNLPDLPQKRPEFPFQIKTSPRFARYLVNSDAPNKSPFISLCEIIATISGPTVVIAFLVFIGNLLTSLMFNEGSIIIPMIVCILALVLSNHLPALAKRPSKGSIGHRLKTPLDLSTAHWNRPPISDGQDPTPQPCPMHLQMYKTGRKTIATVTEITYCPHNIDDSTPGMSSENCRIQTPPTFKIWYKFNPPDDDNPNDIIHAIVVHRDPKGLIKVGSPLPILYHATAAGIQSMPYPFPLTDLELPGDYLGGMPVIDQ